jgi:hypothetical protein
MDAQRNQREDWWKGQIFGQNERSGLRAEARLSLDDAYKRAQVALSAQRESGRNERAEETIEDRNARQQRSLAATQAAQQQRRADAARASVTKRYEGQDASPDFINEKIQEELGSPDLARQYPDAVQGADGEPMIPGQAAQPSTAPAPAVPQSGQAQPATSTPAPTQSSGIPVSQMTPAQLNSEIAAGWGAMSPKDAVRLRDNMQAGRDRSLPPLPAVPGVENWTVGEDGVPYVMKDPNAGVSFAPVPTGQPSNGVRTEKDVTVPNPSVEVPAGGFGVPAGSAAKPVPEKVQRPKLLSVKEKAAQKADLEGAREIAQRKIDMVLFPGGKTNGALPVNLEPGSQAEAVVNYAQEQVNEIDKELLALYGRPWDRPPSATEKEEEKKAHQERMKTFNPPSITNPPAPGVVKELAQEPTAASMVAQDTFRAGSMSVPFAPTAVTPFTEQRPSAQSAPIATETHEQWQARMEQWKTDQAKAFAAAAIESEAELRKTRPDLTDEQIAVILGRAGVR